MNIKILNEKYLIIILATSLAIILVLFTGQNVFATSCVNGCSGSATSITVGASIYGSNPTEAHGSGFIYGEVVCSTCCVWSDDMIIKIGCKNYVASYEVVPINGEYSANIPYNAGTYIYSSVVQNYCDGTGCSSIAFLNDGCGI